MVSIELIGVLPDLLSEVLLVLEPLIPLLLDLVLSMTLFKGQLKRPIEHVEASRELEEVVDHLCLIDDI